MYYLSFFIVLLLFLHIQSFITNSHNPGVFSLSYVLTGFSTIHFPLCMETESNEEKKSVGIQKYVPRQQSSNFTFPESLFHFCIQVNTQILYVPSSMQLPCSTAPKLHAPQLHSTVFFKANVIDSSLVGSMSSLKMILFCTSGVRYCFFICVYSC